MRCQTAERGAWMTVDSVTELEVGIMLVMMDKIVEMILQKLSVRDLIVRKMKFDDLETFVKYVMYSYV